MSFHWIANKMSKALIFCLCLFIHNKCNRATWFGCCLQSNNSALYLCSSFTYHMYLTSFKNSRTICVLNSIVSSFQRCQMAKYRLEIRNCTWNRTWTCTRELHKKNKRIVLELVIYDCWKGNYNYHICILIKRRKGRVKQRRAQGITEGRCLNFGTDACIRH